MNGSSKYGIFIGIKNFDFINVLKLVLKRTFIPNLEFGE
jgi:hypothetical protein